MDRIEQGLRTQIMMGPEQAPLDPGEVVAAAREDAWIRVLVALTEDTGLHAAWARSVSPGESAWDAAGRAAWVQAEIDEVDERIDGWLAEGKQGLESEDEATRRAVESLEALGRNGIGWGGESMAALFPPPDGEMTPAVEALSMVSSVGAPGALRGALHHTDVLDNVVGYLRSAALSGASELWDQFLVWHNRLADVDRDDQPEAWHSRLEGVGACLDPVLFARGLLAGDYDMGWALHSEAVADFLHTWGATDWLEVVGLLEHAESPAVETCSVAAVCASRGIGDSAPDDDETESLIELLGYDLSAGEAEDWEPLASQLGLQFPIAVGASVDATDTEVAGSFGGLLAQIAAHERLVVHGIHSPGVPGLPLSATTRAYIDLDAAELAVRELADSVVGGGEDAGGEVIRAVRTLCDAATWYRRNAGAFESVVRTACEAFEPAASDAVQLARAQLLVAIDGGSAAGEIDMKADVVRALSRTGALATGNELDDDIVQTLGDLADGESVAALDAARRLGLAGGSASKRRLAELWTSGPVRRATFVRRVLVESLASQ